MKPLKLVPANEPVAALLALAEVLAGTEALYITAAEVNGEKPKLTPLPDSVGPEVGLVVESSGSTGLPKRIELSAAALISAAESSAARLGGHGQWLLTLPINYIAGSMVLVRSLLAESQPVVMNTSMPFTAEGFSRAASLMTGERRYVSLVPAQLDRLFSAAQTDEYLLGQLRRFDAILVGGQMPKLSPIEVLRELGVNIVVSYGMAETAGGVVYDGVPLAGVTVTLSEALTVQIDSPTIALGLARPYQTNDLGTLVDGVLTVTGRADRVIISGGEKLSLEAVEAWTMSQLNVSAAAAVLVRNSKFGQGFVCFVQCGLGFEFDPSRASLDLGVAAKSGTWRAIERLPMLSSGKPDLEFLTVVANQFGESSD